MTGFLARALRAFFVTHPNVRHADVGVVRIASVNLYWPLPIGQMRRNKERVRLTEWNVGFYKHTTLERVRHDIRT